MAVSRKQFEEAVIELIVASSLLQRRLGVASNWQALTWSQMSIMGDLAKNGPKTTTELARAQAMRGTSMGQALDLLEKEGLVQRHPHPSDGRQILYYITKEGKKARDKARAARRAWLEKTMQNVDVADREAVVVAANVIRAMSEL